MSIYIHTYYRYIIKVFIESKIIYPQKTASFYSATGDVFYVQRDRIGPE